MAKLLIAFLGLAGLVTALTPIDAGAQRQVPRAGEAKTAVGDAGGALVGTWKLARIELLGPGGEVLPAPAPPSFGSPGPIGVMFYGPGGHFGVTIMQSGRPRYAGAQPTPEEAKKALAGFIAYFGTYGADAASRTLTHHVEGSLHPNDTGSLEQSAFQLSGGQLTLTPAHQRAGSRWRSLWERVADLPQLTPTHRRMVGFWRRASRDRRTPNGELYDSDPVRQAGVLIFTAAGYMAVHGMQPGRTKFAGPEPTPAEAKAAIDSYGSAYFGPFTVNEAEQLEVTRQIGLINPGQVGMDARRHLEFPGPDRMTLKPPVETVNGLQLQSYVHWERVSGEGLPK